ncbi:MFS-type transporter SLC18B1-like isoform X4 [Nilaparvata lugens]|uniref:MFS-type transporter SLC18B1-like isoform X3 n=1 Tax=Nilaparvata lugens TaxID=108931 RepID=UPI00193E59E0|nr:MFS-type transporter SLC18B1-like isoform X3 [Nilaparvata lugens]XP_039295921.1 MFS-type transporter SLC18B1-like isoform X3 [Nilaparvata lugens]XP_039295922.1 MFS-type transporter SLC18B1-like isoform X3 [Nilaparvata lugens]XP_039295924.1 MFS-type transporter SLC18B1-like isoform X4 [Nilaparvata lugens]XP_039295925.1 MFS-type transporter SLC18B1-like isoform X4 [Nilaparvata lugens]
MLRLSNFTRRQLLTLVVLSIGDFCNAICVSLQAPFYPQEAEKKGATATEYGLVFGVFELIVFAVSPFYGQHLNRIGPKTLFNGGIFTTGVCAILFGLLDKVDGHYPFITLSFVIRIVEALGNAAFLIATFAIIAKEFPDNVATTFASLETCFGFGLIVGPTVGGILYQAGGYTTPFLVMGSALFMSAIMTAFVLPDHPDREEDSKAGASLLEVLRIPGVVLAAASIIVTSMSIGFLSALLEPHLRQFNLPPAILGVMFVINGGTYALTAPCWGWLCDGRRLHPKVASVTGCILLIAGFSAIGPIPFLPIPTTLWLTIVGLVIHGLGIAALLVSSFTDALRCAISHGFPNNLETYGLISGLWTSTFALGAFIGPSIAGVLYDAFGFRAATLLIIVLGAVVGAIVLIFICCTKPQNMYKEIPSAASASLPEEIGGSSHTPLLGDKSPRLVASNGHINIVGSTASLACPGERPPGMNGIIACSSYKNRLGNWHRKESGATLGNQYSSSYGSFEHSAHRAFYEST